MTPASINLRSGKFLWEGFPACWEGEEEAGPVFFRTIPWKILEFVGAEN